MMNIVNPVECNQFYIDPEEERFNELMTEENVELLNKLLNKPRLVVDNTSAPMREAVADAALDFLEKLRPGGPWVLTAIKPDGPIETITANNADDVRAFVERNNGVRNLYFSVKPIMPKERPRGENVVDLMDALRKSVGGGAGETKAPKKSAKKPRKAAAGQKEMLMPITTKKPAKEAAAKKPAARPQRKSA
jgi:hypothetical protein